MQARSRQDRSIEQAITLARGAAPDLTSVLITHYPDLETLDTFRPGETTLDTVAAMNRTVATELAAAGVRVFVQLADRASLRRWLTGRPDTQENRWAWRDRSHLLRGAAALKMLGADPARWRTASWLPLRTTAAPNSRILCMTSWPPGGATSWTSRCARQPTASARRPSMTFSGR